MFVTYQPARVIKASEITLEAKKAALIGDEGLSARVSFPKGIVVCGKGQPDKEKGYVTGEGEIIEISGEIYIYNPSDSAKSVFVLLTDTF